MKILTAALAILVTSTLLYAAPEPAPACTSPSETDPRPVETPLPNLDDVQRGCKKFGTPVARFLITTEGKTKNHRLIRGTGCSRADKEVLKSLRNWLYVPATRQGKPVAKTVTVVINWDSGSP